MRLIHAIIISTVLGVAVLVGAYFLKDYWQALLINLGTGFLGLSIGLVVVNHLLARDEKRKAAVPLLRMIAPSVSELHNDHFIAPGRRTFGMPVFHDIIDAYHSNNRRPEALSPQQRDEFYALIKDRREQVLPLLETIHDQFKEMTSLLGWSFSPNMVTASLTARLDIVKFKALLFDDSEATKLSACELYFDIDASCGAVMQDLATLLGTTVAEES